jgi:hypothetical protein
MMKIETNSQQLHEIEELRKKLGLSSAYISSMRRLRANLIIHVEVLEAEFAPPKLQVIAQNLFSQLASFERQRDGLNGWKAKFIDAYCEKYLEKLEVTKISENRVMSGGPFFNEGM